MGVRFDWIARPTPDPGWANKAFQRPYLPPAVYFAGSGIPIQGFRNNTPIGTYQDQTVPVVSLDGAGLPYAQFFSTPLVKRK